MKKITMTANSIVFTCIGTGICTCEYIQLQYLVLKVSVKSGIGAALVYIFDTPILYYMGFYQALQ